MTATSSWTRSSQVMKRVLHTLPQKPSSSTCIGVTMDLPARWYSSRLGRRGKWFVRFSGTDGAFFSSTSWPEVRWWILRLNAKHCRNCDGSFKTSGARWLVPAIQDSTVNTSAAGVHPPYGSDPAPGDYHLFLYLKKFLSGQSQHFQNDREAEMNITQWFQFQAADFYDTGIQKLVSRCDRCLSSRGEYVEK